jgi:phosphotransferase system enzyme I (PtsI)
MIIKKGIPVSPGVAISRAVVLDAEDVPVPRRTVPAAQVARQHERLQEALAKTVKDLEQLRDQAKSSVGAELARIFDVHLAMLADKHVLDQFKLLIDNERVTAEYAVYSVMRQLANVLGQQQSRLFRDRVSDIWDLERQVLAHLIGSTRTELNDLPAEAVLVAHDLTPSQTAGLDTNRVKGIATNAGGRTSHTAILAHSLGIPAIVGLEDLTSQVAPGDTVIIDGNRGLVIVDPDAAQLLEYRQYSEKIAAFEDTLGELATLPAETLDGTKVGLYANIEFPDEVAAALGKGAVGIGLYRTEFIFLGAETEPNEEQQYDAYVAAIEASGGRPLTIRTLDLGADKLWGLPNLDHGERNPFLGCRSIRLCLQNLPLFKNQLRAILRASVEGPVRIMFPLISNIMELRQARMILNDVMEDLEDEGIAYRQNIPIGIMIEVPSAALQANVLAREVDFFSIGTNDLIQYTVAVDRSNERIASLYSAAHPSVIQLIKDVVRAANRAKIDVSLCGEMASEIDFTMLLLGLGLRSLSITPPAIPEVKKIIRSVSMNQCKRVARKVMTFESDREVLNYLRDEVRRVVPEAYQSRPAEN